MNIVGCGGSTHDFSSCILRDDEILVAVEDERIGRIRHGINLSCKSSISYCLKNAGIEIGNVEAVYANDMIAGSLLGPLKDKVMRLGHHEAHAYGTFFTCPVNNAAILVADGCGSVTREGNGLHYRETTSFYHGEGDSIRLVNRIEGEREGPSEQNPIDAITMDSLGDFYEAITLEIGFNVLQAGKTMGLSPYGDGSYYALFSKFITLLANGQFRIDVRGPNSLLTEIRKLLSAVNTELDRFVVKACLANACQFWLEEILVHCLNYLYEETHSKNLCFSGGVALNCVFNGKITQRTKFSEVFVPFAPGDNGTAIGAAIYGRQQMARSERKVRVTPFLGHRYSRDEIVSACSQLDGSIMIRESHDICAEAAYHLSQNRIVGWFQERSEFGPRALGNRSIITSPTNHAIKSILNKRVKHREAFRPYAPAILAEFVTEYFDRWIASPYMQFSIQIKPEQRTRIPAVCHIDGSARLQTVTEQDNRLFHRLIHEFYRITGIPLVLNTSFNANGEPIVETPEQALHTFLGNEMDVIVLGNFLILKHP